MTDSSHDDTPELAEVASLLGLGPSDVVEEPPPPELWARIEAGIAAEAASDIGSAGASGATEGGEVLSEESDGSVILLDTARNARNRAIAIAVGVAAALLLVAIPVALALGSSDSGSDPSQPMADLVALAGFGGEGSAELDGRELRVETTGLTPAEGSAYELWLLDLEGDELQDLVWVGVIEADGTYRIDDGVDLDRFDVVDISREPNDGNPEHSGDSLLRGELST